MAIVEYNVEGAVGTITINRPKALNALNSEVLSELDKIFDNVDQNSVRCLIITGSGDKSFVAGADIGEMHNLDGEGGKAFGIKGNAVMRKIETFPLPVIAAINGFALGGGNELAMSCDIRICSDNATFGQPETGLGVTPGFGGTQRLPRLINPGMAKQLLYTSAIFNADEAFRLGLVNAVYPQAELMPVAQKMAAKIAKMGPIAVRDCKILVNEGLEKNMDDAIAFEAEIFGSTFDTNDQKEGMGAFVEKRKEKNFTNS